MTPEERVRAALKVWEQTSLSARSVHRSIVGPMADAIRARASP